MKKYFSILLAVVLFVFASAFSEVGPKTWAVKLGYTCEYIPVAVDSVYGSYDGKVFTYRIMYCSQAFTAPERSIKFNLMFVDKAGNILAETASGPLLKGFKHLSGEHTAGVPLKEVPYDCIITISHKDTDSGHTIESVMPDGTVLKSRSTENDVWQIGNIRSLKLYKQ